MNRCIRNGRFNERRAHRGTWITAKPLRGDVQKIGKQLHHVGAGDGLAANVLADLAFPQLVTLFLGCMDQIRLLHAGGIHGDLQLIGELGLIHILPFVHGSKECSKFNLDYIEHHELINLNLKFNELVN